MSADTAVAAEPPTPGQGPSFTYDAFLSYNRHDGPVAAGIQKGLHRIGRRMGRLNALRVFRDRTDMAANPNLWGKVADAMDRSRYLIVVLSPRAAASEWVNKEVTYWLGKRIISGSGDKTVRLWNADTGQPIGQPMIGHTNMVSSVAFSPDGKRIISGSGDKTVRLWDPDICQPLGDPLTGHTGHVSSVAFSPDGKRIASGSTDKTLRLWNADTAQPLGDPLTGHTDRLSSVAFSPDGQRIVSGSDDTTVRLWPVYPDAVSALCAKLTTNMSHQQWRDWVSPDIDYIEACPGLPIAPDGSR